MSWQSKTTMDLRQEFVMLAQDPKQEMSQLCRRFGIDRSTGYKWLRRFEKDGLSGLENQSRRPKTTPNKVSVSIEEKIVAVRLAHPAWGARKIKAYLTLPNLPAISTITEVLRRNGLLNTQTADQHKSWQRFEHEAPNQLWQMDFKGHFALLTQQRCHPLTLLDDHSRFSLCLAACGNEQGDTVKQHLINTFRRYGLPERMTMDNGSPWGCSSQEQGHTPLTVWLYRVGIRVGHSSPYHPQTQGKDERFHRTLKAEVLQGPPFRSLQNCQQAFDEWRELYNCQRPHQALDMKVPASRYSLSQRAFPEVLPVIEYGPDDTTRLVQTGGWIYFAGREIKVGKAFIGQTVALRPQEEEGLYNIYFCKQPIRQLNLKEV